MISLSGFALRFKPIVVTAVALLMLWGVLAYSTMPRREDPEYTVRTCMVLTTWPGTPTEKVEKFRLQEMGVTGSTWDRERPRRAERSGTPGIRRA